MNPRYRVLSIDGDTYVLDMGKAFWKILFPFSFWIFPNTAYQVNDREIIKKIIVPDTRQKITAWQGLLAGVAGLFLANLLKPLVSYFNIESTLFLSAVVVAFVFIITVLVVYYIHIKSRNSLLSKVDLQQFSVKRLWIRPQSFKHFFFILLTYSLSLSFIILCWGGFIYLANAFILFAGALFLLLLILSSYLTVGVGDTTVKFTTDNNTEAFESGR